MERDDVYEGRNCLVCQYRLRCLKLIIPLGKCPFHVFQQWERDGVVDEKIKHYDFQA